MDSAVAPPSVAAIEAPRSGMTTIDRAVDVLMLFTEREHRTLGVTEIGVALGLSKAVVHRILTSLVDRGLADLDPVSRRYALGPAVLKLGLTYLDRVDVRAMARPVLAGLSEATRETATLSIRNGDTRVYIEQVTPVREVKMSVLLGEPYPLHAGASSKVFLAFLPDAERAAYLDGELAGLTAATVSDRRLLAKELDRIHAVGWATSTGERQAGAMSVAAPIHDAQGTVVAVISVCGPAERFELALDEARPELLSRTRALSARLGWRG